MVTIQDKHFDPETGNWTISAVVILPDGTRCSAYQVTAPADANDEQLTHCLMERFA